MATTTNTRKVLVLLLLALLPLSTLASRAGPSAHRSHGGKPKHSPPAPTPAQPAALVRATCNSTTYPDLCVSALSADPSSATADVRGLSAIAVTAAATNALGGAATAAALANAVTNATAAEQAPSAAAGGDATVQALLRTCAAKYGQARDALSAAGGSIAARDYDSASVQVSAAGEYPQVCRVLFQRQRPGQYPPELAAREVALRQLCTVSLDIITLLSNNSN
ncbi:unnamed protein product [Urochloa humidicola]